MIHGAHQVDREYRVTKELHQLGYPVPRPFIYCGDVNVIGSEFYVCEYVEGRVFNDTTLSSLTPAQRSQVYASLVEALAQLHAVRFEKNPVLSKLTSARKARTPYIKRQVKTWSMIYRQSMVKGQNDCKTQAAMDALMRLLSRPEFLPRQERICLVHGDFKLDQVQRARRREGYRVFYEMKTHLVHPQTARVEHGQFVGVQCASSGSI